MSVFTLLYRRKFVHLARHRDFSVASWTFLVYLTSWNFFSNCMCTLLSTFF